MAAVDTLLKYENFRMCRQQLEEAAILPVTLDHVYDRGVADAKLVGDLRRCFEVHFVKVDDFNPLVRKQILLRFADRHAMDARLIPNLLKTINFDLVLPHYLLGLLRNGDFLYFFNFENRLGQRIGNLGHQLVDGCSIMHHLSAAPFEVILVYFLHRDYIHILA